MMKKKMETMKRKGEKRVRKKMKQKMSRLKLLEWKVVMRIKPD